MSTGIGAPFHAEDDPQDVDRGCGAWTFLWRDPSGAGGETDKLAGHPNHLGI